MKHNSGASCALKADECKAMKLSVIEIVCYSYGRWFFLLPFKV